MRSSQKSNRNRNKSNRPKSLGNVTNRVFESAGPEGKVRGTPQQIIDKYEQLARDSQTAGDRVTAENFLQHAEHYARMLSAAQAEMLAHQQAQQPAVANGAGNGSGQGAGASPQSAPREARRDDAPAAASGAPSGGLETIDASEGPDLVATPESAGEAQPDGESGEAPAKPSRSARRRRSQRRQTGDGDAAASGDASGGDGAPAAASDGDSKPAPASSETAPG